MTAPIRIRPYALVAGVALLVAIAWSLQPATADIGTPNHLWSRHLRSKADARYLRNTKVFVSPTFTLGALAADEFTVDCPTGWQAVGGGVDFEAADAMVHVISSAPLLADTSLFALDEGRNPAASGWRVTAENDGVVAVDGKVGVVCAA